MCNTVRDSGPGETPVTGRELAPQNLPRALPPRHSVSQLRLQSPPGPMRVERQVAFLRPVPWQEGRAEGQVSTLKQDLGGQAPDHSACSRHPESGPWGLQGGKVRVHLGTAGLAAAQSSNHEQTRSDPSSG